MKLLNTVTKIFLFSFFITSFFSLSTPHVFAEDINSTINFAGHSGTSGTVNLHWNDKDYIESYNIAYGPSSGNYLYGVTNVGNISSYTIGGLTPGQTYYFVLSPIDDEKAMAFTYEISVVAGGAAPQKQAMYKDTTKQTYEAKPASYERKVHPKPMTQTQNTTYPETDPNPVPAGTPEDKNFHLRAMKGDTSGTVKLMWDNKGYTENYNIVYGTQPGNYTWGVVGTGHVGEFIIGGLVPGQRYYFALSPVDDNVAMPYTPYVSAVAY